jgi:hypothetical protein
MSHEDVTLPLEVGRAEYSLYRVEHEESFEEVCRELVALCEKLIALLPDVTLSPDERIERLARVVPTSTLLSAHHQTARTKLRRLRERLRELVPVPSLTSLERVDYLVARVHELVPGDEPRLFKKLERLGDHRGSDMGR